MQRGGYSVSAFLRIKNLMMRKLFILALGALLALPLSAADNDSIKAVKQKAKAEKLAAKQKAKAKKERQKTIGQVEKAMPLTLASSSDTLSYTAGVMMTEGLLPYLEKQFGVDSTNLHLFIQGAVEYLQAKDTPEMKAKAAGMQIAGQLSSQMLQSITKEFTGTPDTIVENGLYRGFIDAILGTNTAVSNKDAQQNFEAIRKANQEAKHSATRKQSEDFLVKNATKEGVVVLPSGLQYKVITKGEGAIPTATSNVKVHYEGRLVDGTVFDASLKHGTEPLSFRADQVIKGWTEALTMMPVGSKWELYIPQNLAYGERQAGSIPPYSTLIFTVELLDFE